MATFIDSALQDIDARLKELKAEEEQLLAARAALAGIGDGAGAAAAPAAASTTRARGASRRPRGRAAAKAETAAPARRRPGRPRGRRAGNTRSNQALELVRSQPGITIPQIAETLKIQPNYLYRVMPKLTADGLVTRSGQGWHAVEAPADTTSAD